LWVLAHSTPRLTKLEHVHDVISAEAHAVMQDLILALSMRYNQIILSSDCLEVVNILKEGSNSLGIAAAIIDDCYFLVKEFPKVILSTSFVKQIV
jgi:hypothetical protein